MFSEIFKYLSVFLASSIKFIAGPTMGTIAGFSLFETILITILGMMTSVLIFSFFGEQIKQRFLPKWFKNKKLFSNNNRRFKVLWKRYGLFGVTFLTPILFSPIGGTLLVTATGASRKKVLTYMLFSAVFWSIAFSKVFHLLAIS